MLRGYRGILTALAGLVLAGAQPPQDSGENPQTQPAEQSQSEPSSADPAVEQSDEPPKNDQPCRKGEDDRGSDLCAQWKAADAAQSAAEGTWWLGGFTVLLSALTLGAAVAAAIFAARAARSGQAQTRAYLVCEGGEFTSYPEMMIYQFQVRNVGQSPALNLSGRLWIDTDYGKGPVKRLGPFSRQGIAITAQGCEGLSILVTTDERLVREGDAQATIKLMGAMLTDKDMHHAVDVQIGWDDAFGIRQNQTFHLIEDKKAATFLDGSRGGKFTSHGTSSYIDNVRPRGKRRIR